MTLPAIPAAPAPAPRRGLGQPRRHRHRRGHRRLDPPAVELLQPRRRARHPRPDQPERHVAAGRLPGHGRPDGADGQGHRNRARRGGGYIPRTPTPPPLPSPVTRGATPTASTPKASRARGSASSRKPVGSDDDPDCAEVNKVVRAAIAAIEAAGAEIVEVSLPNLMDFVIETSLYITHSRHDINKFLAARPALPYSSSTPSTRTASTTRISISSPTS